MPSCVIIVENLPVPFDRRVWQEARTLKEAGWVVSVICPATTGFPARRETIEGIRIFRHPLPIEAKGFFGFCLEYAVALFEEFRLLFVVNREVGFDVIQACNPPDLIFLVALPWRLFGKKFVFDHHDVCPELMEAKFGKKRLLNFLTLWLEKLTFMSADLVISANETFRQLAITRGGKRPGSVVTVYSIPDKRFFCRNSSDPQAGPAQLEAPDRTIVIGYVGIIGDQDGVDNVVRMAKELAGRPGLDNFRCVIVGDGPALPHVKQLAASLDVERYLEFTGYVTGAALIEAISEFDIGIIPDPVNPYNDKISMNKVFEYSTIGIPIVAFDLAETKRLLRDAALFAQRGDACGLADEVERLMRSPELRSVLGRKAKQLAEREFIWDAEAKKYVTAMDRLLQLPDPRGAPRAKRSHQLSLRGSVLFLRDILLQARARLLRSFFKMDIHPTAKISLKANLDLTNPSGVHIDQGTYIAFNAVVLAHDMSRLLMLDTFIGKNCFIGAYSIIMPGVRIGDECIVGSGSVVTADVPSHSIVAGNPAKIIRSGVQTRKWGILEEAYARAEAAEAAAAGELTTSLEGVKGAP